MKNRFGNAIRAGFFALCFFLGARLFFSPSVPAEDIRYDKGDRRDPFIPLIGPGGIVDARKFDAKDINVEGIVFDPNGGSMVLINGEFYKEGDHVKSANVISIFRDRVILSQNDEQKTIWIREETVNAQGVITESGTAAAHKPAPPKVSTKPHKMGSKKK